MAATLLRGVPGSAQNLRVPLTGHRARPIAASTLFHTLFSDFFSEGDGTTYVQTGDIPAMWLRDSSAQTIPYVRFAAAYPILAVRFGGVIARNARNIAADPYANAFRADYGVWEEKWEPDSLAWPVLLTWMYWNQTHAAGLFGRDLHKALRTVVDTLRCEQLHAACSRYRYPYPQSTHDEYNPDTGMVWSAFRPSDDPVEYRFNIPQEAIVAVALQEIAELAVAGYGDADLANEASSMAAQVQTGIERYGRIWRADLGGWAYVYETDGLGRYSLMDDANLPNLTALPALAWCSATDPVYLNTRAYTLSKRNPYYFSGTYAEGLGSPHTPAGYVWPLGIISRALTASSGRETAEGITTLAETDSGDGLIHESFYPGGYWRFTRAEFGWANAFYAELVFRSVAGFPAPPLLPQNRTATPFELLSQTPTLTHPLAQIVNTGLVYDALSTLLAQADGHTIIPRESAIIKKTAQ